jgi:hypothetical protein
MREYVLQAIETDLKHLLHIVVVLLAIGVRAQVTLCVAEELVGAQAHQVVLAHILYVCEEAGESHFRDKITGIWQANSALVPER